MTQTAMNLCALDKAKKADAALNDIYEKLMKKAGAAGQAKLRAAQKAWLSYRDLQCAFDTLGTAGGSVHPMIVSECHAYYARLHRKDLEAQLDCAEGNLSCGGQ